MVRESRHLWLTIQSSIKSAYSHKKKEPAIKMTGSESLESYTAGRIRLECIADIYRYNISVPVEVFEVSRCSAARARA